MGQTGLEGPAGRSDSAWRRTLVYFGLADDDRAEAAPAIDESRTRLEALERRVEEQAAEIAALRAEVAELRERR
jgi:hypothetical protein